MMNQVPGAVPGGITTFAVTWLVCAVRLGFEVIRLVGLGDRARVPDIVLASANV